MDRQTILVTGGDSFLIKSIRGHFDGDIFDVKFTGKKDLDCRNLDLVLKEFDHVHYDAVIHAAVSGGRRFDADTPDILYGNLISLENLLFCKEKGLFKRLITFGSGCELSDSVPQKSYDLSKYIQLKRVFGMEGVANLRIFGLFSELDNKDFISDCIFKCRNNAPVVIWNDRLFDFIYAKDLFKIVLHVLSKEDYKYIGVDCVYPKKYTLSEIAFFIKKITMSKSEIFVENNGGSQYIGQSPPHGSISGIGDSIESSLIDLAG
jgi:nucleoside-diphosphate-sugar epimerase